VKHNATKCTHYKIANQTKTSRNGFQREKENATHIMFSIKKESDTSITTVTFDIKESNTMID
jgi:hypothetical protein